LKDLAGLKRLQRLTLNKTLVGDAEFQELAAFHRLQLVDICQTRVTRKGVAQLRMALPNLGIFEGFEK
jgi:hypothetical protein